MTAEMLCTCSRITTCAWICLLSQRSTLSEGDTFGDKVFGGDDSEQVRISTVVSAQHGSEVAVISEDDYNKHFKSNSGAICFVPKHAIEVFKKECVCGLLFESSELLNRWTPQSP